ncbi:MAG: hypothetical protein V4732_10690 [Pseudomonadota bacterium]
MEYMLALFNIFFSPITFLLFFIIATPLNHIAFTAGSETNVMKLVPRAYFVFGAALAIIALLLVAGYNIAAPQKILLIDILQPTNYWVSIISWIITACTLHIYIKGMEGNVMGFIFFPMLFISSLALIVINAPALVTGFNMGGKPLPLNPWIAFFIHGCNPLLILLFNANETSDANETASKKAVGGGAKYISILIFYAFIIPLHWLVFTFFGKTLDISDFFGVGQSLAYFLPFIGGALLHMYYDFLIKEKLSDSPLKIGVGISLSIITTICIALQCINYVQYWQRVW